MRRNSHRPAVALLSSIIATLFLASCGGGGGESAAGASTNPGSATTSTSTPSTTTITAASLGSSPITEGTVTGFGSVIIDGLRIENKDTASQVELPDDTTVTSELKIGHHVIVEHDDSLVASKVRIVPTVKGTVTATDQASGTLAVFGQQVIVNTLTASGPITVFEAPYTKISDIAINDVVEVHAVPVLTSGKMVLQATRIQKSPSNGFNQVRGLVSDFIGTAKTFRIGDLTVSYAGANIKPLGASITNGSVVEVDFAPTTTFTGATIAATVVKVKNLHSESGDHNVNIGGPVSDLSVSSKTFRIGDLLINASNAAYPQNGTSFASIKSGSYIRVKGLAQKDGSVVASNIVLREAEIGAEREVELHGSIQNFVSAANFTVRDVQVNGSSATVSCPTGVTLASNLQIEVEGKLDANGKVLASVIKCENVVEGTSVIERNGRATSINVTTKTFVLANGTAQAAVQWSTNTVFVGVDANFLADKSIEVEGVMANNVLLATKIKLDK